MTKIKIIIYEIKYIIVNFILPTMFLLFYFYVLSAKPFPDSINYAVIFISFFPFIFVFYLMMHNNSRRNKFKDKCSEVYEYNYDDINLVINKINKNAKDKGYMYEKKLKTDENEVFLINAIDENDFPLNKIGIYVNDIYTCEYYRHNSRYSSGYVPGEGKTHYLYKPFFNMICGKWGRSYDHPRDWVNIETTIIVIVDEWNDALNWALNDGGHLPFVLFGVIVRSEGNKLFLAKDTRRERRNDYFEKKKELFDLIEVKNRDVVGSLSWRDVYKKIQDKKS